MFRNKLFMKGTNKIVINPDRLFHLASSRNVFR